MNLIRQYKPESCSICDSFWLLRYSVHFVNHFGACSRLTVGFIPSLLQGIPSSSSSLSQTDSSLSQPDSFLSQTDSYLSQTDLEYVTSPYKHKWPKKEVAIRWALSIEKGKGIGVPSNAWKWREFFNLWWFWKSYKYLTLSSKIELIRIQNYPIALLLSLSNENDIVELIPFKLFPTSYF